MNCEGTLDVIRASGRQCRATRSPDGVLRPWVPRRAIRPAPRNPVGAVPHSPGDHDMPNLLPETRIRPLSGACHIPSRIVDPPPALPCINPDALAHSSTAPHRRAGPSLPIAGNRTMKTRRKAIVPAKRAALFSKCTYGQYLEQLHAEP